MSEKVRLTPDSRHRELGAGFGPVWASFSYGGHRRDKGEGHQQERCRQWPPITGQVEGGNETQ